MIKHYEDIFILARKRHEFLEMKGMIIMNREVQTRKELHDKLNTLLESLKNPTYEQLEYEMFGETERIDNVIDLLKVVSLALDTNMNESMPLTSESLDSIYSQLEVCIEGLERSNYNIREIMKDMKKS